MLDTVIQADRDAAAAYYYSAGGSPTIRDAIKRGERDDWFRVQAFTRHRVALSTPPADLIERLTSAPAGAEEAAYAWLEGKYLNVETGHDPADRDFDQEEMVEAFLAGLVARTKAQGRTTMASAKLGPWLAAALDDPAVCDEMKADIREWFSAGEPVSTAPSPSPVARVPDRAETYAEWQQKRGLAIDTIAWAINEYDEFMKDDAYDAQRVLDRIAAKLRERRALFTASPSDGSGEGK